MPGPVRSDTTTRTQQTRATDVAAKSSGLAAAPSWEGATKARPIGRGQEGESVTRLQQELNARGANVAVDGKFGPETEASLRRFQAANGCKVDGLFGPETRAAMERGAVQESQGEASQRRGAEQAVGGNQQRRAPTEQERACTPEGAQRAGELQIAHGSPVRGPQLEVTTDGAGGGTVRGDLGRVELPNGYATGPSGEVTLDAENARISGEGRLARLENNEGGFIDVGRLSGQAGADGARLEGTAFEVSTGDDHIVDARVRVGDAGAEASWQATEEEGRIGAGYRANVAEVAVAAGDVSAERTDDYREEVRVSAGVPSGGAFVSWNDRDGDGARNYRLDVDVPIPGTPLGVGLSVESESPIRDGMALIAAANPVTAPFAAAHRLGRMFNVW